ncbi:MAG: recombinase family protein, partial [Gammaproteobacteria bacterium]
GTLRLPLPTGFVYDPAGQIVLDPDEAVQAAIRMAFDRFEQLGSALAVVRYFREHQLLFPTRRRERTHQGELRWRPLYLSRMMELLHHPAYAGAYSYGRAWERPRRKESGDGSQALARRSPLQEPILQREAHPGYITWEQYQRNQERLDDNRSRPASGQRGAVREGRALLQGIVLCGRCGRRMSVRYVSEGATPAYVCERQHAQYGGKSCQWVHGVGVDATVAQALMEAIQPAQLEVSLAALSQIEARERQVEQQWQLRQERAQYEADLARRRFVAVEPENRLVARSLEKEWNEKLAEVARIEKAAAERPSGWRGRPSPEERERILALASDLPLVWQAATTTPAERKRLLRLLIADVTLTGGEKTVHLGIRWQTGAVTEAEVVRPKKLWEQYATDPAVMERIRALAPTHSDREIAASLNEAGMASAFGRPYSRQLVAWLRRNAGIAPGCREAMRGSGQGIRADGRMSVRRAAQELNCHASTVITWCQQGKLDGIQEHPHAVWWVTLTPEKASQLRKPAGEGATERREEGNGERR